MPLEADVGPSGYLVGEGFTVTDLTAASILGLIVVPPEFPYIKVHQTSAAASAVPRKFLPRQLDPDQLRLDADGLGSQPRVTAEARQHIVIHRDETRPSLLPAATELKAHARVVGDVACEGGVLSVDGDEPGNLTNRGDLRRAARVGPSR